MESKVKKNFTKSKQKSFFMKTFHSIPSFQINLEPSLSTKSKDESSTIQPPFRNNYGPWGYNNNNNIYGYEDYIYDVDLNSKSPDLRGRRKLVVSDDRLIFATDSEFQVFRKGFLLFIHFIFLFSM